MPYSSFNLRIVDYANKKGSFSGRVTLIDAANYDAVTGDIATLISATSAVILGNIDGSTITARNTDLALGPASSTSAQREEKWFIQFKDNVNAKIDTITLPTAKLTSGGSGAGNNLLLPHSDKANWQGSGADPAWTTFVTAWQAVFRTIDGNSATIIDIYNGD